MTAFRPSGLAAGVVAAVVLAACSRGGSRPAAQAPAPAAAPSIPAAVVTTGMVTTLQAVNSPVTGAVQLKPGPTPQEIRATIDIRNSAPGLVHRWEIRPGGCTASPMATTLAPPAAFRTLDVRGDGTAQVQTTLPMAMPLRSAHHVVVLRSRSDDTVIACGALSPEG